jgi:glycosyltransferase involved in cell wall biosynthesis
MSPKISVVVPTSGRSSTLPKAVKSLFSQSFPKAGYEIIIVYSRTDKEVLKGLAGQSPVKFRFFEEKEVGILGAAASRNYGVSVAKGGLIAFMDDDCIAKRDWLAKGWAYYQKHKNYAGFMGTTVTDLDKLTVTSRYMHITKPERVPTCPTCNVFFRRDVFLKYKYPVYKRYAGISHRADTDLAFTMIEKGQKIGFSDATVYHPVYPAPSMKWFINQGRYREVEPLFYKRHPKLYWSGGLPFVSRATIGTWALLALSLYILLAYSPLYAIGFFVLGYGALSIYVLMKKRNMFVLKSIDTVKFVLVLPFRTIIELIYLLRGIFIHWVIERKDMGVK